MLAMLTLAQATTQDTSSVQPLTVAGWTFMLLSIAFVLFLVIFCFYRVLTAPEDGGPSETMHTPLEIETGDKGT